MEKLMLVYQRVADVSINTSIFVGDFPAWTSEG
jgi:hypothetical protein